MAKRQSGQGGIQTVLPGIDWKQCQCGCGQYFIPLKKGRQRKYFNDSHKTRVYRRNKKQRHEYDVETEETWRGWTDESIVAYISACPEAELAWSGQWELYRRGR